MSGGGVYLSGISSTTHGGLHMNSPYPQAAGRARSSPHGGARRPAPRAPDGNRRRAPRNSASRAITPRIASGQVPDRDANAEEVAPHLRRLYRRRLEEAIAALH